MPGYRRAGWRGLLVAGVCFITPAALIVLAWPGCGGVLLSLGALALELIEPARSAQSGRGDVAAPSSSSDRRRPSAKTSRSGQPSGSLWMPMLSWPA